MRNIPPSPPFLGRWWPTLLLLLAAIGVPAATIAFFAHFVADHPWFALGLAIIYEIIIFTYSFAARVWRRLEGPYVEYAAERFDHWLQGIISRYRKQYYDRVSGQTSRAHLDMDGWTYYIQKVTQTL